MYNWFYFSHFIVDIYNAMLNPLMPFIAENLNVSMSKAAMVLSLSYICAAFLQPIFGLFEDKFNTRSFMFIGLLLAAIFIPLVSLAATFKTLVLFVVIGALGISFYHPQALSCVVEKAGLFITAGSLGYAFAPLLSSNIAKYLGLEFIPILSIFGVVCAFLMFKFVPKLECCKVEKVNFIEIFKNSNIRNLTMIAVGKALNTSCCCILLPFYWKSKGFDITYIGIILFLFFFLGGFGSSFSDKIRLKIGDKNIFHLALLGTWVVMMVFFATRNFPVISALVFVLIGFITMMLVPVNIQLAQKSLPEYKSVSAGIINGFSWGVANVLVMIIAPLAQKFGIIYVLFFVSFVPLACNYFVGKLFFAQNR